tara:strand:+ start:193 stop:519 length:327 start_codon:yes stop_codon:yes gene_type:complete
MLSKIKTVFSRKTGVRQPLLNKKRKSKTAKKKKVKSSKKMKKVRSAKKSSSSFVMVNMPVEMKNGPNNFSKQMMNKGGLEYTYSKNGRKQTTLYKASNLPPTLNLAKK